MTSKEALKTIGELYLFEESVQIPYDPPLKEQYKKEYEILLELVERDTDKKVIKDCDGMFRCPSCDGYVSDNVNDGYGSYEELFCDHCGQRLDWGKENDIR